MAKAMSEAVAWRKMAEWVDRNQRVASTGLCCLLSWRVNGSPSPIPVRFPALEMMPRIKSHAAIQQTGCYLDSIDKGAEEIPTPHARVIFCLLMALEAECDAAERGR